MLDKTAAIFEVFEGWNLGDWVWCLHCGRCYQAGEYRLDKDGLELCIYEKCGGDTVFDSIHWEGIRALHPEYPEIPEKDKVYAQY